MMSLLKYIIGGAQPNSDTPTHTTDRSNVVSLGQLHEDFTHLQESVEGLRFSKRDLAHELVLLVRENSRLEEQVYDMKNRIERMEQLIKALTTPGKGY